MAAPPGWKPPNAGKGRTKGSMNKTTRSAKEAIALAAEGLGGAPRLVAWAKEDPQNERVFWGQIYPKLLPLQVNGSGENGEFEHKHDVSIRPQLTRDQWLAMHGVGSAAGKSE